MAAPKTYFVGQFQNNERILATLTFKIQTLLSSSDCHRVQTLGVGVPKDPPSAEGYVSLYDPLLRSLDHTTYDSSKKLALVDNPGRLSFALSPKA